MADFEDANSPTWDNCVRGPDQPARRGAPARSAHAARTGKVYQLNERTATLMVRPRGWHLVEKHVPRRRRAGVGVAVRLRPLLLPQRPRPARARQRALLLPAQAREPPRGAALERRLPPRRRTRSGIPRGTIRATVLIETILAAFEMDEILYELREHSAGLNCGRWDYIFSFIKKFRARPEFVLPDRAQVTMTTPLHALLLAARDPDLPPPRRATRWAAWRRRSRSRTTRRPTRRPSPRCAPTRSARSRDGHDGTWVAHPGLVPARHARSSTPACRPPNQIDRTRDDVAGDRDDLLAGSRRARSPSTACGSTSTSASSTWRRGCGGNGCVPIYNLMEDAATAEISRTQVWQWIRHPAACSTTAARSRPSWCRALIPRGAGQDPRPGRRRALRRRQLRAGEPALRAAGDRRRARGVPDPGRLRAPRLSDSSEEDRRWRP